MKVSYNARCASGSHLRLMSVALKRGQTATSVMPPDWRTILALCISSKVTLTPEL
uniref:Uncharacterized protein n=1 Tax=Arundo donax TaxID=35708 RepID=A0A0A9F6H9_ARUDO